jgi:hypothetical protein
MGLVCIWVVSLLSPVAAQERPRTLGDALKLIDSYKGKSAIDLTPDDIAMLKEARQVLVDQATRVPPELSIAEARAVIRILKGADPAKLNPHEAEALRVMERFLKHRGEEARRAAEAVKRLSPDDRKAMAEVVEKLEEILYTPAVQAPDRAGDARAMLGVWTLRREVSPIGRAAPLNWTVVVLDRVLVRLEPNGEVKVVSPYRLGRYGETLTAIDLAPLSAGARDDARGILEAGDSQMRIAFTYRLTPRPESFKEPSSNDDPKFNPVLWDFERGDRLSFLSGAGRGLKEMTYEEARKALADLDAITGTWESADGSTRLTFSHEQVDAVAEGKPRGRFPYRLNPLTPPGVIEVNPRALGLLTRPGKFTPEYRINDDMLVLMYSNLKAAPPSPNPFDRPEDFPRPEPNKEGKDGEKTTLMLKRVVQKK